MFIQLEKFLHWLHEGPQPKTDNPLWGRPGSGSTEVYDRAAAAKSIQRHRNRTKKQTPAKGAFKTAAVRAAPMPLEDEICALKKIGASRKSLKRS